MLPSPDRWIWSGEDVPAGRPQLCYFRRTVSMAAVPVAAPCRLTADSRYRFFVNGHLVCQGPRKGDDKIWFYDEVDIAPWLHPGKNVLAAAVLHYTPEKGNRSVFRFAQPGFAAIGELEGQVWHTDESWHTRLAANIEFCADYPDTARLYNEERVHGDAALHGWQRPGYDDSAWPAARVLRAIGSPSVSPAFQRPRPIPFLYEEPRTFTLFDRTGPGPDDAAWAALLANGVPLALPPRATVTAVLCADRLTTGWPELAFAGGAGAQVEVLVSEGYAQNGRTGQGVVKTDRLDKKNGHLEGPCDRYTAGGFGTEADPECYEPFWFRAFRFVQLTITTGDVPLKLCHCAWRETGYPLTVRTKVTTSDPSLTEIWRISENSLRACMQETYVDCPFYEQLQYMMDARAEMLFTYTSAADDRLARAALDDFARSQRADGLLNACYPTTKPNVIPGFSLYYLLMLHDHLRYFGDAALLRQYWPVAERILQFFAAQRTPQGLVGQLPNTQFGQAYWGFVDWAPGWPVGVPPAAQAGPLTMDSLLYCLALQCAAEICDFLGRRDQAAQYRTEAAGLRAAVRELCAGRNGLLRDGPGYDGYSEHVQVFAVLTDTLTGSAAHSALERALAETEKGSLAPCSVAMSPYLFAALAKAGLYDRTDALWNKWRAMLANHLTTCVESDGENARSDCHAWGALALHELPAVILGVQPAAPGWSAVAFDPKPGVLRHAEGEVVTPKGIIRAQWHLEDGRIVKHIELPDGMQLVGQPCKE